MRVRKKVVAGSVAMLLLLGLLLLLLTTSTQNVVVSHQDPHLERHILELQEKLDKAESLNKQRENQLFAVLDRMDNDGNVSNSSNQSMTTQDKTTGLQVPGIHSYLPHLSGHPEFLKPTIKFSKGRTAVSVVLGVPTIKRAKESYLIKTLSSLISGLNKEENDDCIIVVFIAEPWDNSYVEQITAAVKDNFSPALESGLLEVIVPPAGFYPNLDNLKETFGDSKERVRWRTKQNLDYAFLMLYGRSKSTYYVQMEDDVMAKPGYVSSMKTFAIQQKGEWIMLEFSALGFIGKLFKSSDVPAVVEFFLMFHADKPIDWLMDHLLWVRMCSPEKDAKHCQRMIQSVRRRFKPSLFQHIGLESSLKGKVQKLKDRDFGKAGLYRAHANPAAEMSTSLKIYQKYTLERAYSGETFFWASNPSKGDTIDFKFNPPVHIEMYLFRSGNTDHPGDIFQNATVELRPVEKVSQSQIDSIVSKSGLSQAEISNTSEGFIAVGSFNDAGLAQGEVPDGIGKVVDLRIRVHEKSDAWVILSEIMIQESKS